MKSKQHEQELLALIDGHYASDQPRDALALAIPLLMVDPLNLYCQYRVAVCLEKLGERTVAAKAMDEVADLFSESGQLLLALAALKSLLDLDEARAKRRITEIVKAYGAGSSRVDAKRPLVPPPRPKREFEFEPLAIESLSSEKLIARAAEVLDTAQRANKALREEIKNQMLPYVPFLGDLGPQELAMVIPVIKIHVLPASKVIIEQGSAGNAMYLIARGEVEVLRDGKLLAELRAGSFFGEMALLTASPRTARVVCKTPSVLFAFPRAALYKVAERQPSVANVLADYAKKRLLHNLMMTNPLFEMLDVPRRHDLIELFTSCVYQPEDIVLKEGDIGEGLYVVLSGAVRVSTKDAEDQLYLADLGSGQVFGEVSLIQNKPVTATVTALDKTVILCLSRDAFNKQVHHFPEVLTHIYRLANERVSVNEQLRQGEVVQLEDGSVLM